MRELSTNSRSSEVGRRANPASVVAIASAPAAIALAA
jgi:hypothetical protein